MAFDVARILLGLIFVLFGLNGFFHWRPLPQMNPEMIKFNENLQATGIIMPVVKLFEIIFGALLFLNQWVFVSTLAVLPICFFIILAHLKFNRPKGLVMAGLFFALSGTLVATQWDRFEMLFL